MLITIIIFIIILGLLVFVHECGHFIVARRNGITAHEFGFGFPPRIIGIVKNEQTGKWQIVRGNKVYEGQKTLYSLNWIPLGGFVRIKGEDGQDKDSDSFATKTAWIRTKVLGAGVVMNFILAWILISFAMGIGVPQPVNQAHGSAVVADPRVQVVSVAPGSPAESMGIRTGDELRVACTSGDSNCSSLAVTQNVQDFIAKNKGQEIVLEVKRGDRLVKLSGIPRIDAPEGEGSLGISMVETALVRYSFFEAIWRGLQTTFNLTVTIVLALYDIIATLLVGEKVSADLAGPVGIAFLTRQVTDLGFVYLVQFAAILSINLGILNVLPIPALDGGRMFFVLIEKIKGSPVSRKIEGIAHSIGFSLLILLMIVVTARDFIRYEVIDKFLRLF